MTDKDWTQNAVSHFTEIESALGIHPDRVIFQTWASLPVHTLPEEQPGAFMNILTFSVYTSRILTHPDPSGVHSYRQRSLTRMGNRCAHAGVVIDAVDVGSPYGDLLKDS